ncbi:hypothetical protein SCP_0203940 [Sparassis crispa]|uniref:Protein kinase domain-containing protein n=1 Tax=Sparassis crispa TaxID=139825 RepID=A0A401GAM1_9APHY|nr:hypothetical protein SCP_0203940 [Sparassis crispa]GBE79197.1 hypothetical protein SCP_0203940 [Sparassis crispa]
MSPEDGIQKRSVISYPEKTDDELFGVLSLWEARWRDRQQFLEAHGYMLRPRYRPGWIPSWRATGGDPMDFEDSVSLPVVQHLIDATRLSDGALVHIKRVNTGDNESQIATMLSSDALRNDPRNHCVPILEVIQDTDDETISYMVMPFLRFIDNPPFQTVENLVDFADQILEGLLFLHQQGVAHRDCTHNNLMMDGSALYPQGFHPVQDECLPDGTTPAGDPSRINVSLKYYFIDFGISSMFPLNVHPKLVLGIDGRDRDVPELSSVVPYDPFAVDIFILGNVFRKHVHKASDTLSVGVFADKII